MNLGFDVTTATLENHGTIQFAGNGIAVERFKGSIDNFGTIDIDANTTISGSGSQNFTLDTREGTIDVAAGVTLTVSQGVGAGTIIVGPNTVWTGPGAIDLTGVTEILVDGSFNVTADTPHLIFSEDITIASLTSGDPVTFTVDSGVTVDLHGATITSDVSVIANGTVYFPALPNQLSMLDGSDGFVLYGEAANDRAAYAVQGIGDINGDGFEDFAIGAPYKYNDTTQSTSAGSVYVIFGSGAAFDPSIDLGNLGTSGFKIEGLYAGQEFGYSVNGAGDVNGDGFDDIVIGAAQESNGDAINAGTVYVLFGSAAPDTGDYDITNLGAAGFTIRGTYANASFGNAVASGDVNGDGFSDLIIGEKNYNNGLGRAYIVYGDDNLAGTELLSGDIYYGSSYAGGVQITGAVYDDGVGFSVSAGGDFNGDGFKDFMISAPFTDVPNGASSVGKAYVVFGKGGGFTSDIDLGDIQLGTGADGFEIISSTLDSNSNLGFALSFLGDINGDGFTDIGVSAPFASSDSQSYNGFYDGISYVIFGTASNVGASFDVSMLGAGEGTYASEGFVINGGAYYAYSGFAMSAAGDVNGDGFDDFLIGAKGYNGEYATTESTTYLVFGRDDTFDYTMNLADMTRDQGFEIIGVDPYDQSGISVSAAGDVNGDGFDDLLIGAPDASGAMNANSYAGEAYIVFGGDFLENVDATGTSGNDILIGSAGNDTLDGGGGADVIRSGAGDDTIIVEDNTFARIDGGGGQDTLVLDGTFNLDLTALAGRFIQGIEEIDMDNGLVNTLDINFNNVFDIGEAVDRLTGTENTLVVSGDANDTVNLIGTWTERSSQPTEASSAGYTVYDNADSQASVAIQNTITTNSTGA